MREKIKSLKSKALSNKALLITIIIFSTVYALISLVNHYFFRTNALDLGLYTNALYDYNHFQWNDSGVFKMNHENLLADHFDLYLILFSPLTFLFKTYTLLVVQIIALIIGGIGIYKFFIHRGESKNFALTATIYFYSFFGVFTALAFDYHSNVVAAAIVPWFFVFVDMQKLKRAFIILVLILVSKENISLWMCFVCLGMMISYRKNKSLRNYLLCTSIFCGVYFITIISVVMPSLAYSNEFAHFRYDYLGKTPIQAITHLISNPIDSFKTLFTNHHNNPQLDYIKAELHIILMCSGLFLLFWKPQYILMLIPIYFQKLYHNNHFMWGVGFQYSIEFAPILSLGIFSVISSFKRKKLKKILTIIVAMMAVISTVRIMDRTIFYTKKSKIRFYKAKHYRRNYDVNRVHKLLDELPHDAKICAQSPFLAHLALRDDIYEFPRVKDAEYIIFSKNEDFYINSKQEFFRKTDSLKRSSEWETIIDDDITILKRK
ncbi:MAG: DUF2079 domain-containing protein [Flavobacteriales bacterium]|nr:DUF2079 domain-containing protein [Flavobacteriales bacterium]